MKNFILKQRKLIIGLTIIFFIIAAGFFYFRSQRTNGRATAEVKRGTVRDELTLSGEIKAFEHAKLSFESSGRIIWVGVKEDQSVKKGQALIKLDTTSLNAAYQQALATLRAAEASVDNVHDQVKNHGNDETFNQRDTRTTAEVTKDKAYEAVIAAERALRGATLIAPFDGVVINLINPFSGVYTTTTEIQLEVLNPATFYFSVTADQTEITNLSTGQKVSIILDSFPDQTFDGTIELITHSPTPDEIGTVYEIKVSFPQEVLDRTKLRLGMTGDAIFVMSESKNVLFVPPQFVKSENGHHYVLTEGGKKISVDLGLEGEDQVEIGGDLKEGTLVYD